MSWLKLFDSFPDNPKILRLSRALKISPVMARGHVATFWAWCLRHAPDGNLVGKDALDVAIAAEWPADAHPERFLDGMILAGLIDAHDDHHVVHNWLKYQGSWTEAQRKQRERDVQMSRTRPGQSQDSPRTVTAKRRGEESRRSINKRASGDAHAHAFDSLWQLVPRKRGKKAALRHWQALIKDHSPQELEEMVKRHNRHHNLADTPVQFIQLGSTLLNNLTDWANGCPECEHGGPCQEERERENT